MTDFGLLSLFTPIMVGALGLLTVSFIVSLRLNAPEVLLLGHLVTYIVVIHATPVVLYGTLRYSWAWKHVGIVDYIMRTGSVDTTIAQLPIYHNWPGFFAGSALLTELVGHTNALNIAIWAPVAFDLFYVLALRFLFRALSTDRRVVWLSIWFFFVVNWVGQDYFSPQAFTFGLYLITLGILLRAFGRESADRSTQGYPPIRHRTALLLSALLIVVMAASHQITPAVLVIVTTALVAFRCLTAWYLPVIAFGAIAAWIALVARGYTLENGGPLLSAVGAIADNTRETFTKSVALNDAQQIVSWGGRAAVVIAGAAALVGISSAWRQRTLQAAPVILMVSPATLVLFTGFGGEVLFRVFLFASPFLAFFAARGASSAGLRTGHGYTFRTSAYGLLLSVLLLPNFLLGYYGKEKQNYFSPSEVSVAARLFAQAPPGTLLVEGTPNYPAQFLHYENFVHVPISREPSAGQARVLADPVGELAAWLSDPTHPAAYVVITASQKSDVDAVDPMPDGSLEHIERALRGSALFRVVFEGDGVTVLELVEQGSGQ